MGAIDRKDAIDGAIYGMAFGDAWGFRTEFKSHADVLALSPEPPDTLQITDDTQMSLYNVSALRAILPSYDLSGLTTDSKLQVEVRGLFADAHLDFEVDPDNNRAPGMTVMGALSALRGSHRLTGLEGSTTNNSKGCGTVMRAPWLGLLPLEDEAIAGLAVLQSETTHGHPYAALCSALVAILMERIVSKRIPEDVLETPILALDYCRFLLDGLVTSGQLEASSQELNGWAARLYRDMGSLIARVALVPLSELKDPQRNICQWFGEGWVADEALYCAVAALALHRESSREGVKRLVYSSGDSDSIAAIGGAFLGALNGYEALEQESSSFGSRVRGSFEPRYEIELASASAFFSDLY